MKTAKLIIGILITVFSSLYLLYSISIYLMAYSYDVDLPYSILLIPITILVVGICLIVSANKKEKAPTYVQHQYTEEERKIYFRNADYKAKPITEYQMDERTKMITYYDRMPSRYQKMLSDYADVLYRRYENEEYLKK